jgi:protein gp37
MGQNSTIEWTHHTFNPWWGCTKVSHGCTHCYAETLSTRYGHAIWGPRKSRRTFGEQHWQEPLKWHKQAAQQNQRMRVFCASMADVFEDNLSVEAERAKLWALIEETPMLDWLLLTKRPELMQRFAPWKDQWPANVWAMTSVENQEQAEIRIPLLANVPAALKGLSVEPLLGAVDLSAWLGVVDWVIVGGESGAQARPMNPKWALDIRDQCVAARVPFFFKQWGEWMPIEADQAATTTGQVVHFQDETATYYLKRAGKKASGHLLDGTTWTQFPPPALDLQPNCDPVGVHKQALTVPS